MLAFPHAFPGTHYLERTIYFSVGRRVDQMEEEFRAEVRRSPRLRDRYSVARVAGGYPLGTVTRAATSRPSLGGYNRQRGWDQQGESILNESGQSVPSTFDLEDDASSTSSGESHCLWSLLTGGRSLLYSCSYTCTWVCRTAPVDSNTDAYLYWCYNYYQGYSL